MKYSLLISITVTALSGWATTKPTTLTCKQRIYLPEYTAFTLTGPKANGSYALKITNKFYGFESTRNATVKKTKTGYSAGDITIKNLEKLSDNSQLILFKAKDIFEQEMRCE